LDAPLRRRAVEVDAFRPVATLGIIWVHVIEYHELGRPAATLGRFGTSYYIAAAVFIALLAARRSRQRTGWAVVTRRARRLLVPFLAWSVVYGVFYAIPAAEAGAQWQLLTRWWGPLAGTAVHLWFLPFVFVVSLLAHALGPWLLRLPVKVLALSAAAAIPLAYWFTYAYTFLALDRAWSVRWHLHRLDRWVEEAPFVVSCLLLAALWLRWRPQGVTGMRPHAPWSLLGALAGLFLVLEIVYAYGSGDWIRLTRSDARFIANAAGATLLGVALIAGGESRLVRRMARIGSHTYFIFLSHLIVIEWASSTWHKWPGYGRLPLAAACAVAVFVVCLALSSLVERLASTHLTRPTLWARLRPKMWSMPGQRLGWAHDAGSLAAARQAGLDEPGQLSQPK
jgi:peptidoglycan/LPS O-acetylase OafA/YrhL